MPQEQRTEREQGVRRIVSTAFSAVQDVVYVALGVLLSIAAILLLVQGGKAILEAGGEGAGVHAIITVLDRILLALMIAELLYTVQVSFREHALVPEPFLLVALIAAVRRILVITAEFSAEEGQSDTAFRNVMSELGLLTVLIVVLVGALVVLQRKTDTEKMARSHHD